MNGAHNVLAKRDPVLLLQNHVTVHSSECSSIFHVLTRSLTAAGSNRIGHNSLPNKSSQNM